MLRTFIRSWACLALGVFLSASPGQSQYLRGVNLAGAEFGDWNVPGDLNIHYIYNGPETFEYFATKGFPLLRVPIRWERIQPTLFAPLDSNQLSLLRQNAAWALDNGARIIIDVHNYGRYRINENGPVREYIINNHYDDGKIKIPAEALEDLWERLSEVFGSDAAVYGYGLMNEPHDMGAADWKQISQGVVTAIRNRGDQKLIFVAGDSWSSAARWPDVNGQQSWIQDPANNFMYEAHLYFDQDASGSYWQSFNDELSQNGDLLNIGRRRLQPFVDWCRANNVRGFLGEYGIPGSDPAWRDVLDNFLTALDEAGMGGTYWAGGEWWGDYSLSVHPWNNFQDDRPQLATLRAHLGASFLTSVSSASYVVGPVAPGSLVAGFGNDLASGSADAQTAVLPTSLLGVEIEAVDQNGQSRALGLIYVSPRQVNYLLAEDLAPGLVELRFKIDGQVYAIESVLAERVAPSLYSAAGNGAGPAAADILRVPAEGPRPPLEPAALRNNPLEHRPIVFEQGDRLFLTLYGTGFRGVTPQDEVSLHIGGLPMKILYIGAQPTFSGLDQVNVELPRELIGAGVVTVTLEVAGRRANALTLLFP